MSDQVHFVCNGEPVALDPTPGVSLLSALREQLGIISVKDGCAPQGQCGCCTVLVDGEARVACVTPLVRVAGRSVITVEGLDPVERDVLTAAFVATGGSQCGFCTPGIVMRAAALRAKGKNRGVDLDRALAAHLCRCTGWQTIYEALTAVSADDDGAPSSRAPDLPARDLDAAGRRATFEGGTAQRVGPDVPIGAAGFADDDAPPDALVAVPRPPGSDAAAIEVGDTHWVVGESLDAARALAGKIQGRRTTAESRPPLAVPPAPLDGVALVTGWVEPAYLEPDASWCVPGGEPANPLANGGAFGGKASSPVADAARTLAGTLARPVRAVFAREDSVRLGPKRPPIAATARLDGRRFEISGTVAGAVEPFLAPVDWAYDVEETGAWSSVRLPGPPTASHLRAVGIAERAVLLEGAIDAAGTDRVALARNERVANTLLATCAPAHGGALAGARVEVDSDGVIVRVQVRVAAGDPLDEIVLRSYAIGAAHMALGWVLSESLTVDPATGEVHDLTIRSFGVIRAQDTPSIDIAIVDDAGPPLPRSSDAVFAAVAAAAWNAISAAEGVRVASFPATETRAARRLRR